MKYQCLVENFDYLNKRIVSITKKLDKYGFKYVYNILNKEVKEVPYYRVDGSVKIKVGNIPAEVQNFEFEMETLKLGNYLPVAIIEHGVVEGVDGVTNKVTLINNDEKIKNDWLNCAGHCDDCNDHYNRQKTVILKSTDGEYKQVGTGCLKKYTGIDCWDIISVYGSVEEIVDKPRYVSYGSEMPQRKYVPTRVFLAACIDIIKEDGTYISSKNGMSSTAHKASNKIKEEKQIYSFAEADIIIDYFKNLICTDDFHDYLTGFDQDVCNACCSEYCKYSDGLVAYAYVAYDNIKSAIAVIKANEEKAANSKYVGNIGDKMNFIAKFTKTLSVDTRYGLSYLYIFEDVDGNELTWFTKTELSGLDKETYYKLFATIKDHKEYDGKRQTVLTRVKFVA